MNMLEHHQRIKDLFSMESDSFIQEAAEELKSYAMADIAPAEDAPSGWQWVVEGVGLTQELPGGDGW